MAHLYSLSTLEAEAWESLSSRLAIVWSITLIPGQPRLLQETLSRKSQKTKVEVEVAHLSSQGG